MNVGLNSMFAMISGKYVNQIRAEKNCICALIQSHIPAYGGQ